MGFWNKIVILRFQKGLVKFMIFLWLYVIVILVIVKFVFFNKMFINDYSLEVVKMYVQLMFKVE